MYTAWIHYWWFIMNETSIRIRVPKDLHDQFSKTCKSNDTTASQAIRASMRSYINKHQTLKIKKTTHE